MQSFHGLFVVYDRYSTIGILRRSSSLTDVRRPVVKRRSTSHNPADETSTTKDKMPVYAIVNKSMKRKNMDSRQEDKSVPDDRAHLYSKVDKSKKKEADVQDAGSGGASTQHEATVDIPEAEISRVATQSVESRRPDSAVSDAGYELIKLNGPSKDAAECDYDTVGGEVAGDDFGYDSVDIVAEAADKDRLPSLATLGRTTEHVYDTVPENPNDLRRLSTDYEDIREISIPVSASDAIH